MRPKIERASSVRPAPMIPAKPTISPRRTWKVDPLHTRRPGTSGCSTVHPSTSKKVSPIDGVWSGKRDSSERPTMPRMMRSSSTASCFTSSVSIERPSRMIVIESAMASISLSLWEMMMLVMPRERRPRSRSSRCSESSSLSADVGSSRMSRRTSFASARAISTSCCLPTPMFLIWASGDSWSPTRAMSSSARRRATPQSMPNDPLTSLPRKMFSVIESSGMSASSWWMMTMPACSLERMSLNRTSAPS